MLFRQATLEGIRGGAITLAFRRWRRPTVRAGGTLLTAIGQIGIDAIDPIDADQIEAQPGVRAGDLAAGLAMERLPFKANVRKLKALGLTISLEIGYELGPRGRIILQALRDRVVGDGRRPHRRGIQVS